MKYPWGPRSCPFGNQGAREIGLVGHREAEQIAVELAGLFQLVDIEAEMAEAADLERPLEQHAADIVTVTVEGHGLPPWRAVKAFSRVF